MELAQVEDPMVYVCFCWIHLFRSKVDGFMPQNQHLNRREVFQPE